MIVEHLKNTTIITQEKKTLPEFVQSLHDSYVSFKNNNIIVNLFSFSQLKASDLNEFLQLSKLHKAEKHSFIIVTKSINYDNVAEGLDIAPTLLEAHDIIEMEEIERDLGF